MPEATLRAVADHGQVPADSVRGHYDEACHVLDELKALGIDYDEVTADLENDGLAKFDASWEQLGEKLATALRRPPPQQPRS